MIDVHAHLCPPYFSKDHVFECLDRAQSNDISRVVVVAETLDDFDAVLELQEERPSIVSSCLGLHPVQRVSIELLSKEQGTSHKEDSLSLAHRLSQSLPRALELIRLNAHRIVGIGEVGLDYCHRRRMLPGETQKEIELIQDHSFQAQIHLANELELPLNVHSRQAGHYTLECLKKCQATKVVMHAFDGKAGYVEEAALRNGYFFSVPPSVVRSDSMKKWIRRLPLDRLLLESDSPALGPTPGEKNEPRNIKMSCATIASLHGVSEEEVRIQSSTNARLLFSRLPQ